MPSYVNRITSQLSSSQYHILSIYDFINYNVHYIIIYIIHYTDRPIVTVQTITTQPQSHVTASLEEMSSAPTYFCSVDAFPTAIGTWRFKGGDLPEGVSQVWYGCHGNTVIIVNSDQ